MRWGDWQWVDNTNIPGWLDWIAFVLGGIGLVAALVQLFRSRGALEAAAEALKTTRRALISNQLLAVLPAFEEIANSLPAAVHADNRVLTGELLLRFEYRVQESLAMLEALDPQFHSAIPTLKTGAQQARTAHTNLYYALTTETTEQRVGKVPAQIVLVALELKALETRLRHNVPAAGVRK